LDAIREWETARLAKAFSQDQMERMKNTNNEFHLEKVNEKGWNLFQYKTFGPFIHEKLNLQPGAPANTECNFELQSFEQPFQFKIDVGGTSGSVKKIKLQLDNYTELEIEQELKPDETLICDGTVLRVFDNKGKQKNTIALGQKIPMLTVGKHIVLLKAMFTGTESPKLLFTVKALDNPEKADAKYE